jgi:hypothetical protein
MNNLIDLIEKKYLNKKKKEKKIIKKSYDRQ